MRPTPKGWPRITSSVFYRDAASAIDWLVEALGFEVRLRIEGEGGRIEHSELTFGEGLISVGSADGKSHKQNREFIASPRDVGDRNTQTLCIYVDDVDALTERARAAGAKVLQAPVTTDYGVEYWADRTAMLADPEGHRWWIMQRMREQGSSGQ